MTTFPATAVEQVADAYHRMTVEARYHPAAPSDGWGHITGPIDVAAESIRYAQGWLTEEDTLDVLGRLPRLARPARAGVHHRGRSTHLWRRTEDRRRAAAHGRRRPRGEGGMTGDVFDYEVGQQLPRIPTDEIVFAVAELDTGLGAVILLPPRWASDALVNVLSARAEAMVAGTCPCCRATSFIPDDRRQILGDVIPDPNVPLRLDHQPGCPVDDLALIPMMRDDLVAFNER